ncbi:hypothetical protein [endosymbiont of Lamellibrachia barhami]|uniref:hypothetical protein n=1 Tax=endosymbiont of Lamellibrachia barhami TaxID=205975 RepID=UPI0015B258C6|nr:hypothetical protein [endosymbiont of Lamellibrachia barhami]
MAIFLSVGFVRNIIFELRQQYQAKTIEETCLVPVARDGSFFHPELHLSKGFQIGKRGHDQRYVYTFEEALEKLQNMDKPRWRRPSATSGVFGTVTSVSWREVNLAELDSVEGKSGQGASS